MIIEKRPIYQMATAVFKFTVYDYLVQFTFYYFIAFFFNNWFHYILSTQLTKYLDIIVSSWKRS